MRYWLIALPFMPGRRDYSRMTVTTVLSAGVGVQRVLIVGHGRRSACG